MEVLLNSVTCPWDSSRSSLVVKEQEVSEAAQPSPASGRPGCNGRPCDPLVWGKLPFQSLSFPGFNEYQ